MKKFGRKSNDIEQQGQLSPSLGQEFNSNEPDIAVASPTIEASLDNDKPIEPLVDDQSTTDSFELLKPNLIETKNTLDGTFRQELKSLMKSFKR